MDKSYSRLSFILVHLLLVVFGSSSGTSPLITSTTKFVKDGPSLTGQFAQWEIRYRAKDYLPVCGVSEEKEGIAYWSNCPECDRAMSRFNSTSVKVGVYDELGAEHPSTDLGNGVRLCMCYSVLHSSGSYLDICLLVGKDLEVLERQGYVAPVAVGIQSPSLDARKLLPDCADYSVSASSGTTASSTATRSSKSILSIGGVIGIAAGILLL